MVTLSRENDSLFSKELTFTQDSQNMVLLETSTSYQAILILIRKFWPIKYLLSIKFNIPFLDHKDVFRNIFLLVDQRASGHTRAKLKKMER